MRAKFYISEIKRYNGSEVLTMSAVGPSSYPNDGSDEDNTYAKWSPQASLSLTITNPALCNKFNPGEKFYVDFTPADVPPTVADDTNKAPA